MVEKQFNEGDVIIREGDYGESFFRIEKGTAAVIVNMGKEDEQKLTELHEGDYFGEMAVLEGYQRSASIVALAGGTEVTEISEKELPNYIDNDPEKLVELMKHLGGRIRQLTLDYNEVCTVLDEVKEKAPEERSEGLLAKIKKFISHAGSAGKYTGPSVEAVRKLESDHSSGFSKSVITYPAGTIIFREGEIGDCMYDIHWGSVGIYSGYGTPEQTLLANLAVNRFFGEMGMIDDEPRSATAVVLEDNTTLEVIGRNDLQDLFKKNPAKVGMILGNLVYRLRTLTNDYVEACVKVKETA